MSIEEKLPEDFIRRMRKQLKEETDDFLASYESEACPGIRINTGKISVREAAGKLPFSLRGIPWTENGFYIDREVSAARHPYYFAGLYYIQEPSAMFPATLLEVQPDDRVLDLCAAPGGKATELASHLTGNGLLVANDVSAGRAGALLKNLTLWGNPNICITVETPQRLQKAFGCYFDKILVDAPCSGEGMFRKDSSLISAWREKGPSGYVPLQKEILSAAIGMLKPGGMLVYSTCTFSREEDEEVIFDALKNHPDLELLSVPMKNGFQRGAVPEDLSDQYAGLLRRCVRIYPHRVEGEGHFTALLRKIEKPAVEKSVIQKKTAVPETIPEQASDLLSVLMSTDSGISGRLKGWRYQQIGEKCLLIPPECLPQNLRYLRTGLLIGTIKNSRFEPSQALALLPEAPCFFHCLDLPAADERVTRYLKGETLELSESELLDAAWKKPDCLPGWILVCVDGHGLGWGRISGSRLKNKYYPGWRLL